MSDEIILALEIGIAIFVLFILIALYGSCKVSGKCSRKEEQEDIRKLIGQEQKLDDSNWQDRLVYDEEFVEKEVKDEQNKNKK